MSEKVVWKDVMRIDRFVAREGDEKKANKYLRLTLRSDGKRKSLFMSMGVASEQTTIKLTSGEALALAKLLEKYAVEVLESGISE